MDRPRRTRQLPARYRGDEFVSEAFGSASTSTNSSANASISATSSARVKSTSRPTAKKVIPMEEDKERIDAFDDVDMEETDGSEEERAESLMSNPTDYARAMDEYLGCSDQVAAEAMTKATVWDGLGEGNHQRIISWLSHYMSFDTICRELHLNPFERQRFMDMYNGEVDDYKSENERLRKGRAQQYELTKLGPFVDMAEWERITDEMTTTDWYPKTFEISQKEAIYAVHYLANFRFIDDFDYEDGDMTKNKFLDAMSEWGVDFTWHGVWPNGPDGDYESDNEDVSLTDEVASETDTEPEPPKKKQPVKKKPNKNGGKRAVVKQNKKKMVPGPSPLKAVTNADDLDKRR